MTIIKLYDKTNSIQEQYEIEGEHFGVTAIGYRFVPKGQNKEYWVHPAQYSKIVIEFND